VRARISLPNQKYATGEQIAAFYTSLLQITRATPGVDSAALINFLPLTGRNYDVTFDIAGQPQRSPADSAHALVRQVDSQALDVLGIVLEKGRVFDEHDRAGTQQVAIISEAMARRYWPNQDPVGQHIIVPINNEESAWEIIGVARDVRTGIASVPEPTIYFPFAQAPYRFMDLVVRSQGDPKAMIENLRGAVSRLDPDQPIYGARTLDSLVDQTLAPWRFSMTLLAIFAAMALALAAAGIYATMSYLVAQRTNEIGVRVALGAQPRDVLRLVIGHGAKIALAGLAVGIVAALALTRMIASLLYSMSPTDPVTFAAVALLLAVVALAASYIPARRAMRVDPMAALRYE
jgi:putative ABC transport system permease protein